MMEIIDLTHEIDEGMPTFTAPWHPLVHIKQLGRIELEGRETRELCIGTHTGTHMDAPLHFIKNGNTIDRIPLDMLIGPVAIVDFSHLKENHAVTAETLEEAKLAKRTIFKFGWGRHWGSKKFFKDYPYFTADAAEYLLSKKVELIGIDTPSPDDSRIKLGGEVDSPVHKTLLDKDVVLIEYLANLDRVRDCGGWNIIALPLKIKGADASPARVCIYR